MLSLLQNQNNQSEDLLDDDDQSEVTSCQKEFQHIFESLIDRMIKSELEDFELVILYLYLLLILSSNSFCTSITITFIFYKLQYNVV